MPRRLFQAGRKFFQTGGKPDQIRGKPNQIRGKEIKGFSFLESSLFKWLRRNPNKKFFGLVLACINKRTSRVKCCEILGVRRRYPRFMLSITAFIAKGTYHVFLFSERKCIDAIHREIARE